MARSRLGPDPTLTRAQRRLSALGIAVEWSGDGAALRGGFEPEGLRNPVSGRPIAHVELSVGEDDRIRFTEPPVLRGVDAPQPAEVGSLAELCALTQARLDKRAAAAEAAGQELRGRGLDPEVDPDSLALALRLEIEGMGAAELDCAAGSLVGRSWQSAFASGGPESIEDFRIELAEIADRMDLELALSTWLERRPKRALKAKRAKPAAAPVIAAPPPVAAGEESRLGAVLEAFGPEARIAAGALLSRDVVYRGEPARFAAQLRGPNTVVASLTTAGGPVWDGELAMSAVANLEGFLAKLEPRRSGGAANEPAEQPAVTWSEAEERLAQGLLPPAPNEMWVMDVRVEHDDGHEVRYRGVNINGQEYGAPRVLAKDAFEDSFVLVGVAYRMPVRVTAVDSRQVTYQRLNAKGEGVGPSRPCPLVVFLANFVPEASAH